MSRYQPALFGGLLIGVLSSLPLISGLNACCCLWVVSGGVLTTYLLQQRTPGPIQTSDALLQGVIAGLIGALITLVGNAVIFTAAGPLFEERLRDALNQGNVPPEMKDNMERLLTGHGILLIQAVVCIPAFALFGMLGALLGTAFFKKKTPPAAPAQPGM